MWSFFGVSVYKKNLGNYYIISSMLKSEQIALCDLFFHQLGLLTIVAVVIIVIVLLLFLSVYFSLLLLIVCILCI